MYTYPNIGLIAKDGRASVSQTLQKLRAHLLEGGASVYPDAIASALLRCPPAHSLAHIGEHCDVAIVVGGDGTLLGAARELAAWSVPIIGVNLGRLGFLVDVPPGKDFAELDAVLAGQHLSETRFLLECEVRRNDAAVFTNVAFNDVILRIRERVRLLEFETRVDEHFVNIQRADGMIVSTPTGSTAYALSAGGPVLSPDTRGILLLPICSHTFSSRPLVVHDDSVIELRVKDDSRELAQLVCDGQISFPVEQDDVIRIRRADAEVTLLHPEKHEFYDLLRAKLHWQ